MTEAIDWWTMCTDTLGLSARRCAYGTKYPEQLLELGIGTDCTHPENCTWPAKLYWQGPSADRLRIGIYHIYLRDWLSVFPKENLLVIPFENYRKNPQVTLSNLVLPFVNLEPFSNKSKSYLEDIENMGYKGNKNEFTEDMLNVTRRLLTAFYKPHNEILARLLINDHYTKIWQH